MRRLINCLLILTAVGGIANADPKQDIEKCATIANAAERLFCFDSLAAQMSSPGSAGDRAMTSQTASPAAARETARPVPPRAEQEHDDFGLEMQQARDSADQIESRYDGFFKGWDGATVFRLENGQVWKQSESGRLSLKAERPMITIKRGWFGAYYLNVEGANKSIRVKRIK